MLKTMPSVPWFIITAYHLGEGRVLKTGFAKVQALEVAYHLGEGRVLKTSYHLVAVTV